MHIHNINFSSLLIKAEENNNGKLGTDLYRSVPVATFLSELYLCIFISSLNTNVTNYLVAMMATIQKPR